MPVRIVTISFAALLAAAAMPVASAEDSPDSRQVTGGVAEMLQHRREMQLREQLVTAGRVDDVRQLDEAIANRARERQAAVIERLNHAIAAPARNTSLQMTGSASVDACDREASRLTATAVR